MAPSVETNSGVAAAITLVEGQLSQLEEQKAALESELERVAAYVTSLRVALDGLLAADAALRPSVGTTAEPATPPPVSAEDAPAAAEPEPAGAAAGPLPAADEPEPKKATRRRAPATQAAPAKRAARKPRGTTPAAAEAGAGPAESKPKARIAKKTPAKKSASPAPAAPTAPKRSRGIADDVLNALAAAGKPVRAGEVSATLSPGSTDDNVRTTLERLVKAGRAQRAGRGLFQALPTG
ncbi:hypothetical protein ABT263_17870 [Kitasatospora sp. NPDC001603]|uniref:hypothetical protein n=1 Tax=Kitasatospora sp. NPDC001603 TaxID=3154388 RepID=UPI00331D0BD6